jgi:hypothetical protein
VRDGQPDTKEAAESGLKQPFTLPHREQPSGDGGNNGGAPPAAAPSTPPHPQ